MGSRGPIAKREGRQRPQPPTADASPARLLAESDLEPSQHWDIEVQDAYTTFLTSPVASAVDPIDIPMVRRLYNYYDLHFKIMSQWAIEMKDSHTASGEANSLVVGGARGMWKVHPYLTSLQRLESSARALEDRLGISPQARARLGIDISEAAVATDKAKRLTRKERPGRL